jgi:uncharacterized protein with NRDE domain
MCTVTFIPTGDRYYITSNRDEKNTRKFAIPPSAYESESGKIFFPKDGDRGGSWIAVHENGNAAVLLNGAFEKHIVQPPYRLSRGKIFLHVIASEFPVKRFERLSLDRIEPFTLVLLDKDDLYECRWDGAKKYCKQLKTYKPYIWSSATLYEEEVVKKRESWFSSFLNAKPNPSQEDVLHFHQFTGDGNKSYDLQMERGELYSTVSITSISTTPGRAAMTYLDLRTHKRSDCSIEFTTDYMYL